MECPRARRDAPWLHTTSAVECWMHSDAASQRLSLWSHISETSASLLHVVGSVSFADHSSGKRAFASAWNTTFNATQRSGYWAPSPVTPHAAASSRCALELQGEHYAFHSRWTGNYAHAVTESLPAIAWMRERMPSSSSLILAKHGPLLSSLLTAIDPAFAERVHWVRPRRRACVQGGLTILWPRSFDWVRCLRTSAQLLALRRWVTRRRVPSGGLLALEPHQQRSPRRLVYCSRTGTLHGELLLDAPCESRDLATLT